MSDALNSMRFKIYGATTIDSAISIADRTAQAFLLGRPYDLEYCAERPDYGYSMFGPTVPSDVWDVDFTVWVQDRED